VKNHHHKNRDQQCTRQASLWVAYFARRNGSHLEARKGIYKQQDRLRESARRWCWTKLVCLRAEKEETCGNEDDDRHELTDGEQVADEGCLSYPEQIDNRQHYDNQHDDRCSPVWQSRGCPKETQVVDQ